MTRASHLPNRPAKYQDGCAGPASTPGAATLGQVTFLRALYARFRDLIHEGARFGVVGFVGLVVTDGLANLLRYQAGLGELSSFAIGIVIATAVTFVGNRFWTYRHRERTGLRRETALFFGVNGSGVDITEVPGVLTYRSTWTAASPTTSPSTAASRPLPSSATGRTRNGYGGQIQRPL